MKRVILRLLITATLGIVGYLLLWPVPIDPVAWDPPPAPDLTGVYVQNNELAKTVRLAVNHQAPEDVAFDNRIASTPAQTTDTFTDCSLTARRQRSSHVPTAGPSVWRSIKMGI